MDFTWLITAILGLLLIYLLYTLSIRNLDYWEKHGVVHTKSLPIIGGMKDVFLGREILPEFVNNIYNKHKRNKFVGYMMFQNPVLVVCDPDLINEILIKDFSCFQDRFAAMDDEADLMNAGMQNISGDRWRVLRHKMTPTFTSGKMKIMFNGIKECTDEAMEYLRTNKEIEVRSFLFKVVLNIIGNIAFGIKADALNKETEKENEFYQNSKDFFKPSILLQLKFLIFSMYPKVKDFIGFKMVDMKVENFFKKLTNDLISYRDKNEGKRYDFLQVMLDQKRKENDLLKTGHSNDLVEELEADEPEDIELLSHLKNVKFDKNARVFTDQLVAGQVFVFISGGTETTASVLSFAVHEVASNKDVQRKLQEEVDSIVASHEFNYEAVRKMKYLEQVLNEVLRLRAPGSFLSRICTEDYTIPGTNLVIKKGQLVNIPVLGIHKDPQYYPDPEKFNPDRFENMDAIPKGVFFPFGGGPRICVAMRLAMLEMKIFMAALVSNYNLTVSKKTQLPLKLDKRSFFQHVIGGLWIKFEPRIK